MAGNGKAYEAAPVHDILHPAHSLHRLSGRTLGISSEGALPEKAHQTMKGTLPPTALDCCIPSFAGTYRPLGLL